MFPEVPPRVEYALTEKGRALVPLIEDMRAYGLQWLSEGCQAAADQRVASSSVARVLTPYAALPAS
jgi:DNA-binding HxlR family transcriptional regulator